MMVEEMKLIMGDSLRGVNYRNPQAYRALEISHIVSKMIPIADIAYQRFKKGFITKHPHRKL